MTHDQTNERSAAVMAGSEGGQLREVDAATQAHGLVIYRASRLEALLPPLRQLLAATPPRHALTPQTLIAAHPGMKQWLNGALAREYGADGIAANLDILLPSAWIDRLAQQQLGQQAVALPRYQRAHLRWTIHAALAGDVRALGVTDARITAYLETHGDADAGSAADAARRRFQLADRLAGLFSQYLVYRPDWLRAWEQGRFQVVTRGAGDAVAASTEQHLLGPLWRHVRARLGAHRGDVVADLIASLGRDGASTADRTALHVFGISHLAPFELAVLRAFARHHLVALYVPDPCREYWGGLARELPGLRAQRAAEVARLEQAGGNDYWVEQTHPLLANWGRMGQHFIMALADSDGDVLEDVRHWQDTQPAPAHDRLHRVQQSIRELRPELLVHHLGDAAATAAERADASLRIHSCHTRLRELEVLRDHLLDVLATPGADGVPVKPSDIVVMAPDIQAYVPLIPSVFGVPGDTHERLPYHLADTAVARSHSLFTAFRRLLDLPGTRVTAPEVVDLLAVPEVARRLNLDAAGLDELTEWLRRSRVAWALDPAFRARFGVPPIAAHTFGWAMDRMLGGYLMADATTDDRQPSVALPDGSELAPLTSIHGPAASNLGALDQLLGAVQSLCDLAAKALQASAWAPALERHFEALFRIDRTDRAARDAQALLLRFIRSIATEPAAAGEDPLLHFAVVRDLLVARLSAAPERQRFLMGGITFCGMVPQRAIPFQVVAVLGLNDGEFPRAASDSGLDLMVRFRRLGDRDVRTDDRYLFLETLMSARRRLHLSYLGEGVRDGKPRNPAAPLAELLAVLDGAAGLRADDTTTDRPWRVRHPLQPFDPRYFDAADPRLFSYSAAFAAMHGRAAAPAVPAFLQESVAVVAADNIGDALPATVGAPLVTLRELASYYKDPSTQLLKQHLHVSLDALDDERLPQQEPLAAQFAPLDTVARKLFFNDGLAGGAWALEQPPTWLRLGGIMPPGQPGVAAWQDELVAVNALLAKTQGLPGFAQAAPVASNHAIDLDVTGWRVSGQVEKVFVTTVDGAVQWQLLRPFPARKGKLKAEFELNFKDRVPLFLDWALLRLHTARALGADAPPIRLRVLVADQEPRWQAGINAWDERFMAVPFGARAPLLADLERRVGQLLQWWHAAQTAPRWYFPKAAWETLKAELYPKPARPKAAGAADVPAKPPTVSVGQVWVSTHDGGGERGYAPGYSQLLAGDVDFADGSPELAALHTFAQQLHACISFNAEPAEDAS
jgi:exodeoxyribonuclease V gamma subunit